MSVRAAAEDLPRLRFVPAPAKKPRRRGPVVLASLYEGRIVEQGEVPTRSDDYHDLFNALAFCAFPRAKWALHARQYGIYRARLTPGATRLPGARTREQDALALFDEGGLLVALAEGVRAGLPGGPVARDLMLAELVRAGRAQVVPFGHALHEHLVAGLPPPFAYAHTVELAELPAAGTLAALDVFDRRLARALADAEFAAPHASAARRSPS